jgi:hypothetical protein
MPGEQPSSLTGHCLRLIAAHLPRFSLDSVPCHLLKPLLVHVLDVCHTSQRAAGNAAAWARALDALLRALSAADQSFGRRVVFAHGPRHARGWSLLSACHPNLAVLSLPGTACDAALAAAAECTHLRRLDVSHSSSVTLSGALALGSGPARHSLRCLLAADCPLVDDGFVSAVTAWPQLRYFDLSGTAVTDGALAHLVRARTDAPLPLVHLRLARCSRIRGRPDAVSWADALCSALPSLQRLDVSGTSALLVYEAQLRCEASPGQKTAANALSGPSRRRAPVLVSALGASSAAAPKLWTRDCEHPFPGPEVVDDEGKEASWGGPSIAALIARVASDALADTARGVTPLFDGGRAVHGDIIGGVKRPAGEPLQPLRRLVAVGRGDFDAQLH